MALRRTRGAQADADAPQPQNQQRIGDLLPGEILTIDEATALFAQNNGVFTRINTTQAVLKDGIEQCVTSTTRNGQVQMEILRVSASLMHRFAGPTSDGPQIQHAPIQINGQNIDLAQLTQLIHTKRSQTQGQGVPMANLASIYLQVLFEIWKRDQPSDWAIEYEAPDTTSDNPARRGIYRIAQVSSVIRKLQNAPQAQAAADFSELTALFGTPQQAPQTPQAPAAQWDPAANGWTHIPALGKWTHANGALVDTTPTAQTPTTP